MRGYVGRYRAFRADGLSRRKALYFALPSRLLAFFALLHNGTVVYGANVTGRIDVDRSHSFLGDTTFNSVQDAVLHGSQDDIRAVLSKGAPERARGRHMAVMASEDVLRVVEHDLPLFVRESHWTLDDRD